MEKTSREYAEKLANEMFAPTDFYTKVSYINGYMKAIEETNVKGFLEVRYIIEKNTEKLNILKANRAKCEDEKWTDAEIQECDRLIVQLAEILSELNSALVV